MILEPILSVVLVLLMRKTLRKDGIREDWQKGLTYLMFCLIGLFLIQVIFDVESITIWVFHILLIGIIWITYGMPEFRHLKYLMVAFLPLIIISILQDLFDLFPGKWAGEVRSYVDMAIPLAIVWLIAQWIIAGKQRKALEKEKLKRELEEEQNRLMAIKKNELEHLVTERTAEITRQKEELEETLKELRATQDQLIQSEKMASLGVLTAGIAHEIQNPLNFVNNFAELSVELVHELKVDIENSMLSPEEKSNMKSIVDDLVQNQEKINFHGKRADTIVKSMLQHSRSHSGQKEETDINELTDEYLRLSFHGLRARDKSFNALFETSLDPTLGKIKVVPQDIGRVLLNIFNNAFYATDKKKQQLGDHYKPVVKVSTHNLGSRVEIRITDNGPGIPDKILDKIFQPFFTTKPTGQGTGLGLSLSYDIVKAHNGEIKVETKPGEGTEFLLRLPT